MVALDIQETSKALAVGGGYVVFFGMVSYYVKEKLYLSEALIATVVGILFGPSLADIFSPTKWAADTSMLTYEITRIVIGIQVLFTGISLPARYPLKHWKSLSVLLGPVMTTAWFITSLLVWGLIPNLTFLESLVIGACVTPTDPVLSNSICKGGYAEQNVPVHVRQIILAEAGANDGLGFPFLFIPLYLILIHSPTHPIHSVKGAIGEWFYNIMFYQVLLSVVVGIIIGYLARKVLYFARSHHINARMIDRESYVSFGVALTFLTLGIIGTLGSDDLLCCFVVGNSLSWDDQYRIDSESDSFQETIDTLLNSGVFLYVGAIIPWSSFTEYGLAPWRLVVLGLCVMALRRVPWVLGLYKIIPSLHNMSEALFAGYFGPIGVGAVFYSMVALEKLPNDGSRDHLRDILVPVNLFLVFTSIVVHGATLPLGKLTEHGYKRATTRQDDEGNRLPITWSASTRVPFFKTRTIPVDSMASSIREQKEGQGGTRTPNPMTPYPKAVDRPASPQSRANSPIPTSARNNSKQPAVVRTSVPAEPAIAFAEPVIVRAVPDAGSPSNNP